MAFAVLDGSEDVRRPYPRTNTYRSYGHDALYDEAALQYCKRRPQLIVHTCRVADIHIVAK